MLLQYNFGVGNARAVDQAFTSIERRIARHNAFVRQSFGPPTRGGVRTGTDRMRGTGEAQQAARAARERQVAINRQLSTETALGRQRVREERDRQRAIDRQLRSQQSLSRQRAREEAGRERLLRREERVVEGRVRSVRGMVGAGVGRVGRTVGAVGRAGLALVGIGGAALGAAAISQAGRLDEQARRLAIQGRDVGQSGVDPEQLRRQFVQTGIARGVSPEDVAAGTAAFVEKTGDIDTAIKNMDVFATVAQAAGARVEDIASAAADLSDKMDIKSIKDMREALATLVFQGKSGAFELRNMAEEFPEIAAQAATFGIKGVGGIRQLGGLLQLARKTTGSASETTTAVNTMFQMLAAESDKLQSGKAFGGAVSSKVQVFEGGDATKPLRNFVDVLADVLAASSGNLVQLQDVFKKRGIKAINPFIPTARAAREEVLARGGSEKEAREAVRDAVRAQIAGAADVPGDFQEIERDAADAMKSFSVQMEIFSSQIKDAIASELFPELIKLAPEMRKLVPHVASFTRSLVDLVRYVAENPLKSVFVAMAASVGLEIAKAGVGRAVSTALTAVISKGSVGAVGTGGVGGGTVVAGRGGGGVIAAAGYAIIAALIVDGITDAIAAYGEKKFREEEAKKKEEIAAKGKKSRGIIEDTGDMTEEQAKAVYGQEGVEAVRARKTGGLSGGLANKILEEENAKRGLSNVEQAREARATMERQASEIGAMSGPLRGGPELFVGEVSELFGKPAQEQSDAAKDTKDAAGDLKQAARELKDAIRLNRGPSPGSPKN